ncbi:choline kinase [Erysipelothrix sp. strain 2 (EsS2-7-Brazil)]|uniref:phosphotransferase n=1 Tax=Erysipelothrix sp. strain 2 (EsS2-7-Brazil) TaxID=2500579 RepID=UPI00190C4CA7|nr:phosphotransferase [Erysipelothrix sp. strain 2 (EsS2-7-Brazil)]MBK2404046.1 choline kinase [Erysipelothrix sp. strain 2 (EsS2-7-Brazil)]
MKIQKTIVQILNEAPLQIEHIETGLTNDNYHVKTKHYDVVLRMPKPENQGLFDYHHEASVLNLLKTTELEPHLWYFDPKTGIKCADYVHGAQTFSIEYLERAAKLMASLHKRHLKSAKIFSIKAHFELYCSRIQNPYYHLDFVENLMNQADHYTHDDPILCHNDLVPGNFLFTDTHDYLIDYEYAMDNDPCSDVMSFITENDIIDHETRNRFYIAYFGSLPDAALQHKLDVFEVAHNALWCAWGQMMFESHQQPIYQEIADLKYQRLCEAYQKTAHANV